MIHDADEALTILRRGPLDHDNPLIDEDRVKEAIDYLILTDPRFMIHALQALAIYTGKLADRVRRAELTLFNALTE